MIIHDTFTLERTYDASVADVWRYWTDPELRQLWFRGPEGYEIAERTVDFKVGGTEVLRGRMPASMGGIRTSFRSTYYVIAPQQHIVTAYIMHLDDVRLVARVHEDRVQVFPVARIILEREADERFPGGIG